jgi:hypothetical protein
MTNAPSLPDPRLDADKQWEKSLEALKVAWQHMLLAYDVRAQRELGALYGLALSFNGIYVPPASMHATVHFGSASLSRIAPVSEIPGPTSKYFRLTKRCSTGTPASDVLVRKSFNP